MILLPATVTIEGLAHAAGISLSRARRHVHLGALVPSERDGRGANLFSRDEVLVAALVKKMQEALGDTSKVPLAVAAKLRPHVTGYHLQMAAPHHPGEPIRMGISQGPVFITVELSVDELDEICARLAELAERTEPRRSADIYESKRS